jgi:2-methylisocitrate lyase-like PEP mutase family enzyme
MLLFVLLQVSATLLGEPDLGLLTPPEMARKAGQIIYGIPNVPVLVDADTGEKIYIYIYTSNS